MNVYDEIIWFDGLDDILVICDHGIKYVNLLSKIIYYSFNDSINNIN